MPGFLGSGDLYLDRLTDAGVSTGLVKVGNATKFALKVDSEVKEQKSRGRTTFGQTLDSVPLITAATVAIELNQIDNDALAMIFLGETSVLSITAGTATAEAVTAHLGKAARLTYRNASTVVVKDATGVTTYVLDTDYTLDARNGFITPLVGGAITEGDILHVDYAYAGVEGQTIKGSTKPTVRVAMFLDGKNQVDGSDALVDVYDTKLTPDSEVDFLADDFTTFSATGAMTTPTGQDHPFKVDRPVAA